MISTDQRKSEYDPHCSTSLFAVAYSSCRLPTKDGLLDWDCAESINIPDMEKALSHIRSEGTFPVSKE